MHTKIISVQVAKDQYGVEIPKPVELKSDKPLESAAVAKALSAYKEIKSAPIQNGRIAPEKQKALTVALETLKSTGISVRSA